MTTWGDENLVHYTAPAEWDESKVVTGLWEKIPVVASAAKTTYTIAMESTHHKTEHYAYVGLDYETALLCALAETEKHTKQLKIPRWDSVNGAFVLVDGMISCVATVSVMWTSGKFFTVDVMVNEVSTTMQLINDGDL